MWNTGKSFLSLTMNFLSTFAGIGGFDLGLERAGMSCKGQIEIDSNCLNVLSRHFPHATRYHDIRRFSCDDIQERIDLICGGFPCQDISVAQRGSRTGLAGERSGLWFEFARLVDEFVPESILLENVPRLLTSNNGRDFATIVSTLVGWGYGICWRILDAQYFGSPGTRRRLFIVGHLGDIQTPYKILFGGQAIGKVLPHNKAQRGIKPMLVGWDGGLTLERLRQTIFYNGRWRKLTPLEQERIMGFPDDWTAGLDDKTRYRQLGNAVCVYVSQWIGQRIAQETLMQD